jgi:hypothetical protein
MEFTGPVEAISLLESDFAVVQKLLGEEIWRAGDADLVECLRGCTGSAGRCRDCRLGWSMRSSSVGCPPL